MFPGGAWQPEDAEGQRDALTDTRVAQPALGMAGLALADLLQRLGVRPQMLAGHSYGELVALCVAGALPEASLLALSELRGRRIVDACASAGDPGAMAAVAAGAATTAAHLAGLPDTIVANENAPDQSVISGPAAHVATAIARLQGAGIAAKPIAVACAFHSPLVHPACRTFAADLDAVAIGPPAQVVYSNTTAAPYPHDAGAIRAQLAEHVGQPVRFAAQIEAMHAAGARIFVEVGPGRVLTGLVTKILGARPHAAVACDRAGEAGITQLLLALGQLAVHGVPLDTEALFAGRAAALFDLAAPPSVVPSPSSWWVNGQRAWPMHGELPANGMRPVQEPVVLRQAHAQLETASGQKQAVVLEYLRNVREMVEAQRRVMLTYLGSDPGEYPVIEGALAAPPPTVSLAPTPELPALIVVASVAPQPAVVDVQALLLSIVSERTGYPLEMLDLDLDLEADLSIDSIKRVEILGTIAERLRPGMTAGHDELPEDLVAVKTLRGIALALAPLAAAAARAAESSAPAASAEAVPAVHAPSPVPRYVVRHEPSTRSAHAWRLADHEIRIVGAAPKLKAMLLRGLARAGSARAPRAGAGGVGEGEALVDLTPLRADWKPTDVPALFGRVRDALVNGASHVLVAGTVGGPGQGGINGQRINGHLVPPSGGVSGMIKSLRKEWPDRQIRVANFAPRLPSAELAARVLDELNAADDAGEVGYSPEGVRQTPRIVRAERNGKEAPPQIALDRDSVVLLTGGARGITARRVRFARRFGCRLELVGRTPLPPWREADADLAAAADARAVRQALIARNTHQGPAAIEAACARVLAEREIRDTLAAIRAAGATVTYHALDVRDAAAFGRADRRHLRARMAASTASFMARASSRTSWRATRRRSRSHAYSKPRSTAALAIAEKVRQDIGFVVFFSSIAVDVRQSRPVRLRGGQRLSRPPRRAAQRDAAGSRRLDQLGAVG